MGKKKGKKRGKFWWGGFCPFFFTRVVRSTPLFVYPFSELVNVSFRGKRHRKLVCRFSSSKPTATSFTSLSAETPLNTHVNFFQIPS